MDDELCPQCGEDHDILSVQAMRVPTIRGSRMRHGGPFTTESGLTLGSGEWRQIRCVFCGSECMTPVEAIPPIACQTPDGAYLGHCASCDVDLRQGFQPGHNPNRRRRRRR
jgi:hypothetical protein